MNKVQRQIRRWNWNKYDKHTNERFKKKLHYQTRTLLCPSSLATIENPLPQNHACKSLQLSPRLQFPESQYWHTVDWVFLAILLSVSNPPLCKVDEFLTLLFELLCHVLERRSWDCLGGFDVGDSECRNLHGFRVHLPESQWTQTSFTVPPLTLSLTDRRVLSATLPTVFTTIFYTQNMYRRNSVSHREWGKTIWPITSFYDEEKRPKLESAIKRIGFRSLVLCEPRFPKRCWINQQHLFPTNTTRKNPNNGNPKSLILWSLNP